MDHIYRFYGPLMQALGGASSLTIDVLFPPHIMTGVLGPEMAQNGRTILPVSSQQHHTQCDQHRPAPAIRRARPYDHRHSVLFHVPFVSFLVATEPARQRRRAPGSRTKMVGEWNRFRT
ncbi:hypothetical protein [Trinickia mobilis]|uniref:hypothetical protein n=1 Tax=Trinickia mobilis TaxID=2816356 RepID=UPI001A8E77D2|nr:hypothetical protein [Trinickia mobilis]